MTSWNLEIRSISITRLKRDNQCSFTGSHNLEIRSISITRLKLSCITWHRRRIRHLKSEVSRLRDWNLCFHHDTQYPVGYLKSEVSRLRDWNGVINPPSPISCILEIRSISITRLKLGRFSTGGNEVARQLEIRSISITRLKHRISPSGNLTELTWNQKYLDYEIETKWLARLRMWSSSLKSEVSRLRDWNRKWLVSDRVLIRTWNQKYLDYEIET